MKSTALFFMITVFLTGHAQQKWSYGDCVEYARKHNISLQQSRLAVENSRLALEEAKAQYEPTLSASTTHGLTNAPWKSDDDNTSYAANVGLNAGWTIWNGGERSNTIRRKEIQTKIDAFSENSLMNTLEQNILNLYVNILYAKESIDISREAAEVSAAQAKRARQLMEGGTMSKVDYAQLAALAEQDRYGVVSAEAAYNTQRMELKRLLELKLDDDLALKEVEWSSEDVLMPLPDKNESYELALTVDDLLHADKLQLEASAYDEKIAKASGLPSLSLNAGVGTSYSSLGGGVGSQLKRSFNENVGLTVNVPILNQRRTKVAVAQAKIQQLNASLDVQSRENELSQAVESVYVDILSAQSRYEAGVAQVESARLSDELVSARFELGRVEPVELLTAHNNLTKARRELLQAKYMAMLGKKQLEFLRTNTVDMP